MTLKYLLSGTEFDKYMPRYYYYSDTKKGLIPLIDNSIKDNTIEGFIETLKQVNTLAAKPCNGSGSQGFFKIDYLDNKVYINGNKTSENDLKLFIEEHYNFVFTEYLYPEKSMKKISPLIYTLRIVVANETGDDPFIIGGYLRFANSTTGVANHMTGITDVEFDVDTTVDWQTGRFFDSRAVRLNSVTHLSVHPDNGEIIEGYIPNWKELLDFVYGFSIKYSLCEFLGFDLCVSDNGIKLMEINSHPGIRHMQLASPLMKDDRTGTYFKNKISNLQNMSDAEIFARHKCWR